MSQSSPSIQAVRRLAASVEKEVDALAEACRRHDSLEIPLGGGLTHEAREPSFFLCHHGGAMIGFASAPPDQPVEVLGMVHPEHRREGIGRALLAAVAAECHRRGATDLLLVSEEASASGLAFAEAVGGAYRFSEHRMQLDEDAFRKLAPRRAPIELARAEPGDLHSLVSIRTAGFGGDAREAEEEIRRWLGEEDQQIHIARSAGEAIGMVRLSRYESDGFIQSLAVLPAHRGRGFGRTILAHGVDALLADDREPILLEVETDNRAALGLYHACGFREISTYRYYGLRS